MAKIKLIDLPRKKKLSKEELKQVQGGKKNYVVTFGTPTIHSK
jgi:bacteriocin-like protein